MNIYFNINNLIFVFFLFVADALGRIHHKIYRLTESLIYMVIHPTQILQVLTLFKPLILLHYIDIKFYSLLRILADTRLIGYNN